MNQSLDMLIAMGTVGLEAHRKAQAEAAAQAEALRLKENAEKWAEYLAPVYAALPPELHQYVSYPADQRPAYDCVEDRRVSLKAIPYANIVIGQQYRDTLRYFPQKANDPWRGYSDEYYLRYDDDGYGYTDPLVALAHAVELAVHNATMEEKAAALNAELAEKAAERVAQQKKPSAIEVIEAQIATGNSLSAIALALLELVKNHD